MSLEFPPKSERFPGSIFIPAVLPCLGGELALKSRGIPDRSNFAIESPNTKHERRRLSGVDGREIRIVSDFPTDLFAAANEYARQGLILVPQWSAEGAKTGKEPVLKGYKTLRSTEMDRGFLSKHWENCSRNIGLLLDNDHVVIDLDSKPNQGAAALSWYERHTGLHHLPCEQTPGGMHLHLICPDLPELIAGERLSVTLPPPNSGDTRKVEAELFTRSMKVTVAPSVGKAGAYKWMKTGVLPVMRWNEIQEIFRFPKPRTSGIRSVARYGNSEFRGDLRTLDIKALCQEAKIYGEQMDEEKGTHSVKCPFSKEHSDSGQEWTAADSASVVFENKDGERPGFRCLHSHCESRRLTDFLKRLNQIHPGIVDRHCSEMSRPIVELPRPGRTLSQFGAEVGKIVGDTKKIFVRGDTICQAKRESKSRGMLPSMALEEITATKAITRFERFIDFRTSAKGGDELISHSPSKAVVETLLQADTFRRYLPSLQSTTIVPIPYLKNGKLHYPVEGFNEDSEIYMSEGAPRPKPMSLEQAKNVLDELLGNEDGKGFCWKDSGDQVKAVARLLTPYCRGLMSWAKTPVFVITANQPRCGKDQFSNLVSRVYTGVDASGAPLGKANDDEMRKRITANLRAGKLFQHFANMKGVVEFPSLEAATDRSTTFEDRILGESESLSLTNTAEYSLSLNIGSQLSPDLEGRALIISLHYSGEDPNKRRFRIIDMDRYIEERRTEILGALDACVRRWIEQGCPVGPTPFASFPDWGRVVGGIMTACELGDPCLRDSESPLKDHRLADMKRLFKFAFDSCEGRMIGKDRLYQLVRDCPDEIFPYFELADRSGQTGFGKLLVQYDGRILSGIRMTIIDSDPNRKRYRFERVEDDGIQTLQTLQTSNQGSEPSSSLNDPKSKVSGSSVHGVPSAVGQESDVCDVCRVCDYELIEDEAAFRDVVRDLSVLKDGARVALDIETYGQGKEDALNPRHGRIRLIGLRYGSESPVKLLDVQKLGDQVMRKELVPQLARLELVGHHLKFDVGFLRHHLGLEAGSVFCTMTASKLLAAGHKDLKNDLKSVAERFLHLSLKKGQGDSDWSGDLKKEQLDYAAEDVAHLFHLAQTLEGKMGREGLETVAAMEMELIPVVVAMEAHGVPVDTTELNLQLGIQCKEADRMEQEVRRIAGDPKLNPRSPDQLRNVFEKVGAPLTDTKEETLKACRHSLSNAVLDYRKAYKQVASLEGLEKAITPEGRIHARFDPLGADTGRFSCSKPNLQQVPRGEPRKLLAAPEGSLLVVADYSQIELRGAAVVAGEQKMIAAYQQGTDLHSQTASLILGKPLNQVTKEERQLAKAVNFGLLFGQKEKGLVDYARSGYGVTMTEEQAEGYRQRFLDAYPDLARWQEQQRKKANSATEAQNRVGRRRLLPSGKEMWWRRYSTLLNFPIQSAAAEGMKQALVWLHRDLPDSARVISTIHDEVIVEVQGTREEAQDVARRVERIMVEAMKTVFPEVPIEVEASVCTDWSGK